MKGISKQEMTRIRDAFEGARLGKRIALLEPLVVEARKLQRQRRAAREIVMAWKVIETCRNDPAKAVRMGATVQAIPWIVENSAEELICAAMEIWPPED